MDWYYAKGEDRSGPVDDHEFQRLVQQGVITPATLIWRDGMAGWQPHGAGTPPPMPGIATAGAAVCTSCGRSVPTSEIFSLSGKQYCAACKPQVLERITTGQPITNQAAEGLRNAHIKHEASVKSIGVLYYLGGVALFFLGIASLLPGFAGTRGASGPETFVAAGFFFLLSVAQIWVGTGLRRLRSWARIPTGILSGLGLLGFPIGTIVNGYILWLIFSQKGKTVFSDEYQAVIAQTPHIKYRTSVLVWILLGLVLLIIAVGGIAMIFDKR